MAGSSTVWGRCRDCPTAARSEEACLAGPAALFVHPRPTCVSSWESVMTKGKAMTATAAASLALISFAKAAFVREIPSSQAQDVSRAWFSIGVILVCAVLFLFARKRSSH